MGRRLNGSDACVAGSLPPPLFGSLSYVETSAASGLNVSKPVDLLLERIMARMNEAVEEAFSPGHRGKMSLHANVSPSTNKKQNNK